MGCRMLLFSSPVSSSMSSSLSSPLSLSLLLLLMLLLKKRVGGSEGRVIAVLELGKGTVLELGKGAVRVSFGDGVDDLAFRLTTTSGSSCWTFRKKLVGKQGHNE